MPRAAALPVCAQCRPVAPPASSTSAAAIITAAACAIVIALTRRLERHTLLALADMALKPDSEQLEGRGGALRQRSEERTHVVELAGPR